MVPFHVRSKVCIAPIYMRSKVCKFAPHMKGSNTDFALHLEGTHADFAPHMERRHSFRDQMIAKTTSFFSPIFKGNFFKQLFIWPMWPLLRRKKIFEGGYLKGENLCLWKLVETHLPLHRQIKLDIRLYFSWRPLQTCLFWSVILNISCFNGWRHDHGFHKNAVKKVGQKKAYLIVKKYWNKLIKSKIQF